MPRARRSDSARGTRLQSFLSGTTFVTNPSGVTIDYNGINIAGSVLDSTEWTYLDGIAGYPLAFSAIAGYDTTAGIKTWAGSSIAIKPGFTIAALVCNFVRNDAAAASPPVGIEYLLTGGGTAATVGLYTIDPTLATMALYQSGGSVAWFAIGT